MEHVSFSRSLSQNEKLSVSIERPSNDSSFHEKQLVQVNKHFQATGRSLLVVEVHHLNPSTFQLLARIGNGFEDHVKESYLSHLPDEETFTIIPNYVSILLSLFSCDPIAWLTKMKTMSNFIECR